MFNVPSNISDLVTTVDITDLVEEMEGFDLDCKPKEILAFMNNCAYKLEGIIQKMFEKVFPDISDEEIVWFMSSITIVPHEVRTSLFTKYYLSISEISVCTEEKWIDRQVLQWGLLLGAPITSKWSFSIDDQLPFSVRLKGEEEIERMHGDLPGSTVTFFMELIRHYMPGARLIIENVWELRPFISPHVLFPMGSRVEPSVSGDDMKNLLKKIEFSVGRAIALVE